MKSKLMIVGLMVAVFSFTAAFAFAAAGEPWFVIKDKNGICKVTQAKDKTPATLAGPYTTKAEAKKARGQVCEGFFRPKPKKAKPVKAVKPAPAKPAEVKPKPVEAKPEVK